MVRSRTPNATKPDPLARSFNDAAHLLGVSDTTLRALADAGEIRTIRIGGRRLIPSTEIARILAGTAHTERAEG